MKTTSPFLLCGNPVLDIDSNQFVFHTRYPKFVARIIVLDKYEEIIYIKDNEPSSTFLYSTRDNNIKIYVISIELVIDKFGEDIQMNLLKKAGDWYYNYLLFSEKNALLIYENMEVTEMLAAKSFFVDYSALAPELKLIYSHHSQKWMVIFRDTTKIFKTECEMNDFLDSIGFTPDVIPYGLINKFYVEDD